MQQVVFGCTMLLIGYFIAAVLFSFEPSGNTAHSPIRKPRISAAQFEALSQSGFPSPSKSLTPYTVQSTYYNFAVPTPVEPVDKGTDPYLIDPQNGEERHYAWELYNRTDIDMKIVPFLLNYLAYNTPSHLISLGPQVCERKLLIQTCCGGNFGTTLFRLAAAIKTAMLLNRTIAVDVGKYSDEFEYFDIPFATKSFIFRLFHRHRCPTPGYINDGPEFNQYIRLVWHQPLVQHLVEKTDELDKSVMPAFCESDEIKNKMRDDSSAYWWIYLRCRDLMVLPPILYIDVGDLYQFMKLISWNPSYVTSPLYNAVVPADIIMHKELFFIFFRPAASIRQIVKDFTQGRGFDYMIHFRTGRAEHTGPFIQSLAKTIKGEYKNEILEARSKEINIPIWGAPSTPLRVFIASSQYSPSILCAYITGNITAIQREIIKDSSQRIPGVDCIYFNATLHAEKYGLPPTLSLNQVNWSPFDWGINPSWAAIVEIFSVYPLTFGMFGLVESSFAGLFRLVSEKSSFSQHGQLNRNKELFWPF